MQKTVLITGASSGIGQAAVETFAKAGWNVAATSRKADVDFNHLPMVKQYKLDVTLPKQVNSVFQAVLSDFKTIDVVVNNAGYSLKGVFEAMDDDQLKHQFDTNVLGLMTVTREAVSSMRQSGGGTIIQVSSMGGRVTFPLYSVYHATKWAVEGFSESLQFELKSQNISVKIIEPGVIKTKFYGSSQTAVQADPSLGYDDILAKTDNRSKDAASGGEDPAIVARCILRAATDKSGKLRYRVGSPSPALLTLRKLLPERLFIWLVGKQFGL